MQLDGLDGNRPDCVGSSGPVRLNLWAGCFLAVSETGSRTSHEEEQDTTRVPNTFK